MDAGIAGGAQSFGVGSTMVGKTLEGLSRGDLVRRPEGKGNHLLWVIGHMAHARNGLLNMIGVKRESRWPELFGRGKDGKGTEDYPDTAEIRAYFEEVTTALKKRLEEITPEELSELSPYDFPTEDKTLRGTVNFMAWHDGYHVGQLSMLRALLGKGGLAG